MSISLRSQTNTDEYTILEFLNNSDATIRKMNCMHIGIHMIIPQFLSEINCRTP